MAKRFPQSMLTYVKVVQTQPLIACPNGSWEHGVTVEEQARYAGRQAAFAWVLQIFDGSPVDGIGLERMRIAGIPVLLTKKQRTKLYFAQLWTNMIARLESQWNFDPENGWDQVNGKGVPANEAYGFYETLKDLDEEFGLSVAFSFSWWDQKTQPEDLGDKILKLENRIVAQELRMENIGVLERDLERQTIVNWLRGPHQGSDTEAWKGSIRPLYDELADLIARGVHSC